MRKQTIVFFLRAMHPCLRRMQQGAATPTLAQTPYYRLAYVRMHACYAPVLTQDAAACSTALILEPLLLKIVVVYGVYRC